MPWLETDTQTNINISAATAIGAYTATFDGIIFADISLDQVAGNGDYVAYITRQINGAGSSYVVLPKTTMTAASGETAIGGQTIGVTVRSGDVLTCYVDGLAGDTTTPDTIVRWYSWTPLQPTVEGRSLDITATGAAGVDWANVENPTTTVGLTNTTFADNTTLTRLGTTLVISGAGPNYQFTADALELSPAASGATVQITATQAAQVATGQLSMYSYITFSQAISSDSTLALPGTKMWWAVKENTSDDDTAALVFVEYTDGLTIVDGSTDGGFSSTDGSITVAGGSGAWTITLRMEENATALLADKNSTYAYELKALVSGDTHIISTGKCTINTGIVQAYS